MTVAIQNLDSDGASTLLGVTWPDAVAGVNQAPRKFGIENQSDRSLAAVSIGIQSVGTNDGASMLQIALDTVTLPRPYGVTLALSGAGAGGVWGATGTYGYRVSAFNAIGETIASSEVTINVDVVTKKVTISWVQITGASGYYIYRTATAGTYVTPALRTTIGSGATISFVDDGSAVSTGAPAADNRTAGWFTTLVLSGAAAGGVWSGTGLKYYRVAALDSTGQVFATSIEASVTVDDVTKKVTVSWAAVSGASTYSVYRSITSGAYVSPAFVASTAGLSFVDDGSAATTGSLFLPPSYGVPPGVFTASPVVVGTMPVGLEAFYWVQRVVSASTPELGNPRLAQIQIKEN